jgi:hypothetical protein
VTSCGTLAICAVGSVCSEGIAVGRGILRGSSVLIESQPALASTDRLGVSQRRTALRVDGLVLNQKPVKIHDQYQAALQLKKIH